MSLLILFTNLAAKLIFGYFATDRSKVREKRARKKSPEESTGYDSRNVMAPDNGKKISKKVRIKKMRKKFLAAAVAMTMVVSAVFTGCGGSSASDEVILYTNADDEAIEAMKSTLDENGYSGQYIVQSFGTSESWRQASGRGN